MRMDFTAIPSETPEALPSSHSPLGANEQQTP